MKIVSAKRMARRLMNKHGLTNWTFKIDNAKKRFGYCSNGKRTISLSGPLTELNSMEQVRDTILHEIAHALAPRAGHGLEWRRMCLRIGAEPTRCYDATVIQPIHNPASVRHYVGKCPACDYQTVRLRRRSCSCPNCDPKWNPEYKLIWLTGETTAEAITRLKETK